MNAAISHFKIFDIVGNEEVVEDDSKCHCVL
jgi:hypothetical protein